MLSKLKDAIWATGSKQRETGRTSEQDCYWSLDLVCCVTCLRQEE